MYELLGTPAQVLADSVGIRCRLVKGQQYTGSDDVAINFVKLDDGRYWMCNIHIYIFTLMQEC